MDNTLCFGWGLFIFFFGFGLVNLFFKDIAWEIQDRSNRNRGIVNSERTPQWETTTSISGVLIILVSFLALFVMYSRT